MTLWQRITAFLVHGRPAPEAPPAPQPPGVPVIAVGEAPQAPSLPKHSDLIGKPSDLGGKGSELPPTAVEMVARWEGFRAMAYKCPAGVWTIGYGTTRWGDGQPVREGEGPIEVSAARRLLMADLRWAAEAVRDLVTVELTEHQQAALISFVYNVGRKAFSGSTLLGLLNGGDYAGAAAQFGRWNRGGGKVLPGLEARRANEAALFRGHAGRAGI